MRLVKRDALSAQSFRRHISEKRKYRKTWDFSFFTLNKRRKIGFFKKKYVYTYTRVLYKYILYIF